MKYWFILILGLLCSISAHAQCSNTSIASYTCVQIASNGNPGLGSSVSATLSGNTTAGNSLIAVVTGCLNSACNSGNSGQSVTVTDGVNTFNQVQCSPSSTLYNHPCIFIASNVAGGTALPTTATISGGDGQFYYWGISLIEVSGIRNSSPVDQQSITLAGTGTTPSSTTIAAPQQTNEFVLSVNLNQTAASSLTAGSGFTNIYQPNNFSMIEAKNAPTEVNQTGNYTNGSSVNWTTVVVTFYSATGVPNPPAIGQAIQSASSTTCTFSGNVTPGQLIVAYASAFGSTHTVTWSDDRSDVFAQPAIPDNLGTFAWRNANAAHGNNVGDVAYVSKGAGGLTNFTATFNTSTTGTCGAIQIPGMAFASPQDPLKPAVSGANSSAGAVVSVGPITPTPQNVNLLSVLWGTDAAPTVAPGAGFAITQQQQSGTLWSAIEQRSVNAYGSYSGTATLSTNSAWAGLVIPLVSAIGPTGTPSLPIIVPTNAPPNTTFYTHKTVCASGCDFTTPTAAMNVATCGEVISIAHTASFTIDNYEPPANACGLTSQIVVESDDCNFASQACTHLPAINVRISPSMFPYMPTFQQASNGDPIISGLGGHGGWSYYYFRGINFVQASIVYPSVDAYVLFNGTALLTDTTTNTVYEQDAITGKATTNGLHGLGASSPNIVFADGMVTEIHDVTNDSQAIITLACNQHGILISNNYLEAAGENTMMGGGGCSDYSLSAPTNVYDVTVSGNWYDKNPCWYVNDPCYVGTTWNVKNSFELKTCIRCNITGNAFTRDWVQGQQYMLAMNGIGGSNGGTALVIQDVTYTYNLFQSMNRPFYAANNCSVDVNWDCGSMGSFIARILIQNTLFDNISQFYNASTDTNPYAIELAGGPIDVHLYHNDLVTSSYMNNLTLARENTGFGAQPPIGSGLNVSNNILTLGQFGYQESNGGGGGQVGLGVDFPDFVWANNGMVGTYPPPQSSQSFPASNIFENDYSTVDFTNYNNGLNGNYMLTSMSPYHNAGTDGLDIGVWSWLTFNSLVSRAFSGGIVPIPPPPPVQPSGLVIGVKTVIR